jgi:hypothetical protein
MKIIDHKDAINRRQDKRLIIVLTAIHRVSCLNQTVLRVNRVNVNNGVDDTGCCVVVRGTTIPGIAARRIATITRVTIVTTTWVFGLCWFVAVLFCVRTDEWEFIGRTKKESRSNPVRLMTSSEYQTESDSLVGCKVEQLSDSHNFKANSTAHINTLFQAIAPLKVKLGYFGLYLTRFPTSLQKLGI